MLSLGRDFIECLCVYVQQHLFQAMYATAREVYWWVWFVDGFLFGLFEAFFYVFSFLPMYPRRNSWGKDFRVALQASYASLFELFVMFDLICPMFKKCGLLKNVDVHEKH